MVHKWNDPAALAGADRAGNIEAAMLDGPDHNPDVRPVQQCDRQVDPVGEWLAAEPLDGCSRAWLARQGVPPSALLTAPTEIAVQRIATEHGLFRPDPNGIPAMVMAVWDYSPLRIPGASMIDLVSWRPACPSAWWTRTGAASALGEWLTGAGSLADGPVAVRRTPLDWVRAGGDGVCLLAGDQIEQAMILRGLPAIVVDDAEHGRDLDALMRRPIGSVPPIYVRRRAAA